jgi:uncharacterized protein (DUF488 family)
VILESVQPHVGGSRTIDAGGSVWNHAHMTATRIGRSARSLATIRSNPLWVGSIGYERYRDNSDFAQRLADAGVERLVDVRELPISRRRGYHKTALGDVLRTVGIEYVHIKALGNPKPFRDLYKSGRAEEGRRLYERHLLTEGRDALDDLVPLLRDKRTALMCVEHDPSVCHRTVIVDALRDELQLDLDVAEIA